jgi:hypothetical protein
MLWWDMGRLTVWPMAGAARFTLGGIHVATWPRRREPAARLVTDTTKHEGRESGGL